MLENGEFDGIKNSKDCTMAIFAPNSSELPPPEGGDFLALTLKNLLKENNIQYDFRKSEDEAINKIL